MEQDEENETPVRIENYIEYTIPGLSEEQFQQHFRVSRPVFENLLSHVHNKIAKVLVIGRDRISSERQLLAVLWLLATPDSYR